MDNLLRGDAEAMEVDKERAHKDSSSEGSQYTARDDSETSTWACREIPKMYHTVKKARKASNPDRDLQGRNIKTEGTGGFLLDDDTRFLACKNRYNFKRRQNISASFDFETMRCSSCGPPLEHMVLEKKNARRETVEVAPVAFVLADHNFPGIIPVNGEGECLKIFRIEEGNLEELAVAFCDIVSGFTVPAGTLVLISSLSQMAREGPAGYAAAFRRAIGILYKKFGDGLISLHGAFINVEDMDAELIRSCSDFDEWASKYAANYYLPEVARIMRDQLVTTNEAERQPPHRWRGQWPTGMMGNNLLTMVSDGQKNLAATVKRASEDLEYMLIGQLVSELNERTAVDLATEVKVIRTLTGTMTEAGNQPIRTRVILVGASHAARIAVQLEDRDNVHIVDLSDPSWVPSPDYIDCKVEELQEALNVPFEGNTMVVYQLLDSAVYRGRTRDGLSRPYRSPTDNKYHVDGKLEILEGEELKELIKSVIPLLRAGGHHKKVLVTPMQRYVTAPCCSDPDHIINFGRATYAADMVAGLATVREATRKVASDRRITNYRVASFEKLLGWRDGTDNTTLKEYWGRDPIHLSPGGYRKVADNLVKWGDEDDAFSNVKIASRDNRQKWVANDDVVVNRRPSPERTRGGGHWRGRGGHYTNRGGGGGKLWRQHSTSKRRLPY